MAGIFWLATTQMWNRYKKLLMLSIGSIMKPDFGVEVRSINTLW